MAVNVVVCGCRFAGLLLPVVVDAGSGLAFPGCCVGLLFVVVLLLRTLCCSSSFCLCCCCCWCHAVLTVAKV